jgi:hypothetical protein
VSIQIVAYLTFTNGSKEGGTGSDYQAAYHNLTTRWVIGEWNVEKRRIDREI